jgi:hypothetical protein
MLLFICRFRLIFLANGGLCIGVEGIEIINNLDYLKSD